MRSSIGIRIKVKSWIRICIEVKRWLRIRIKVMRIRNPGTNTLSNLHTQSYFWINLHLGFVFTNTLTPFLNSSQRAIVITNTVMCIPCYTLGTVGTGYSLHGPHYNCMQGSLFPTYNPVLLIQIRDPVLFFTLRSRSGIRDGKNRDPGWKSRVVKSEDERASYYFWRIFTTIRTGELITIHLPDFFPERLPPRISESLATLLWVKYTWILCREFGGPGSFRPWIWDGKIRMRG